MVVNMMAAHYCVSQEELIDKSSQGWLAWYEHAEALEYEATALHPTKNTTWDDANAEWTKWAVLLLSIIYSRSFE